MLSNKTSRWSGGSKGLDQEAISEAGKVFFKIEAPSLVMQMPSCYEIFVNKIHRSVFHKRKGFRVIKSLTEFHKAFEKLRPVKKDQLCYCTKAENILALDPKHCPFESAHLRLKERSEGAWENSLGFFRMSQNGTRKYRVVDIASSQLRAPKGKDTSYLESVLVELPDWRVTVEGRGDENPPDSLKIEVHFKDEVCLRKRSVSIRRTENAAYFQFWRAVKRAESLIKAGKSSKVAKHELDNELRGVTSCYPPVEALLLGIFNSTSNVAGRLAALNEHVFDAIAVASVQKELKQELTGAWVPSAGYRAELATTAIAVETFHNALPKLLKSSRGKHVAICGTRIVGKDANRHRLEKSVMRNSRLRDGNILIQEVSEKEGFSDFEFTRPDIDL